MGDNAATRRLVNLDLAHTLPSGGETEELPFGGAIGRYLVLGVLGRGGMGIVYEAYDPALDRRIAVKLLREGAGDDGSEGRARMQREAQACARLSHPNVITVHDVSDHRGALYIAMELVQGTTLGKWQVGRSWREVAAGYCDAARGLGAAHAAGLVHRDFKPDNVLVGDDRRIRVTDFGLARLAGGGGPVTGPGLARPTSPALADNLTADGAVMGTPSYMAPEQIDGDAVDARSDQFSWCVALWEAIYGEQPFVGGNLAMRAAAMRTDVPRPPASTRVPRAVGRILVRGLSPDPAQRRPSMAAVVGALERTMSSRRIAIAAGATAAIAAGALVFAVGRHAGEARPDCAAAGSPARELWTQEVAGGVARAFAATGAPYAADATASLGRSVTAWQGRWQRIAVESCEATRVHGTQSAATLDLRTACLMRARDRLRTEVAGLGALGPGDRKAVEASASLVLPDLDACNDVAALAGATPPPPDPALRVAIEARLAVLERAMKGNLAIERAKEMIPEVEAQVAAAEKLGWLPLVARARRALEDLQYQLGKGKSARATLLAAAADASAAGDLDLLVEIYLDLVEVEARLTSEFALGDGWAKLAGGTLARLGPRPGKQLAVTRARGLVAQRAGRAEDARDAYAAGLALARTLGPRDELRLLIDLGLAESELGALVEAHGHFDRALVLARGELGEHHPRVSQIQHDLGTVVYRQGRYAESEQLFRTALVGRAAAYGKDSTDYALTVEAIGNAEVMQDRVDEARAHFEEAIRIFEARLGPEHPDVANAYNDVGGTYHRAGLYELALANQRRVLALREKALGPDHPDVGQSLVNMAIEAKNLERWEVVDPSYRRALAIFAKAYGADSFEVGITYLNLGEAKRVHGELDAAGEAYGHARRILAAKLGENHPLLAHVWNGIGQLDQARGQLDQALPMLERAVAMREHDNTDATDLAESRFALARAIETTDRARAVRLAGQAHEVYRTAGPGYAKRSVAVQAWLKAHPPP